MIIKKCKDIQKYLEQADCEQQEQHVQIRKDQDLKGLITNMIFPVQSCN